MSNGFDIQDVLIGSIGATLTRALGAIATIWGSALIGCCALIATDLTIAVLALNLDGIFEALQSIPRYVLSAPIQPALSNYGLFYPFLLFALVLIFIRCEDALLFGAFLCGGLISFLVLMQLVGKASAGTIILAFFFCVAFQVTVWLFIEAIRKVLDLRADQHLEQIRQENARLRRLNNERYGTVTRPLDQDR